MNTERSAPGTVVPTAVISIVMLALPVMTPAAVNCAAVGCTDRLPAAIVRLIQSTPPTLILIVSPAPVGAVPTSATTSLGVRVAFNCNGGAWLLPIARVPATCSVAPGDALVPTAP
jgi:hypothetical protein